jgi:hypothetical protein
MIGWICALKEEYRAAVIFLDERYDTASLVWGERDENQYVLGRVGSHNVIIKSPTDRIERTGTRIRNSP